jgi:hypothetical protein
MEETHEMVKLLHHPCKSLGSHTDIVRFKTGALINNLQFPTPYLDDVNVRQAPSLRNGVSQERNRVAKY